MLKPLLFLVVLVGLSALSTADAQSGTYYRWKDASGATHYGDAPPPGGRADAVKVNGSQGTSSSNAAQAVAPAPSTSMAAQGAAAAPSGMAAAELAARSRNCDNAKANLKTLSGNALLVDSADPTTARRMTPEQVQAAQRLANSDVAENCPKGAP
jgi:hypothetical protein